MSPISTKFVESAAESREIKVTNPNALALLAADLEYRLREVILVCFLVLWTNLA